MRLAKHKDLSKPTPACGYHFRFPSYMWPNVSYDKADVPIHFKVTPDRLRRLCAVVLDTQPQAPAYTWRIDEVVDWLCRIGYPAYEETFRANFINGRRLPLLNAKALVDMNIKDFQHIQDIVHGIRILYKSDLQLEQTAYKLYRSRTGHVYENLLRKSDFLIENPKEDEDLDDWAQLCLNTAGYAERKILFGGRQPATQIETTATTTKPVTDTDRNTLLLNALYDSLNEYDL